MTTKVTYSFLNRAIIIYSSLILIFFIKVLRNILRKNYISIKGVKKDSTQYIKMNMIKKVRCMKDSYYIA